MKNPLFTLKYTTYTSPVIGLSLFLLVLLSLFNIIPIRNIATASPISSSPSSSFSPSTLSSSSSSSSSSKLLAQLPSSLRGPQPTSSSALPSLPSLLASSFQSLLTSMLDWLSPVLLVLVSCACGLLLLIRGPKLIKLLFVAASIVFTVALLHSTLSALTTTYLSPSSSASSNSSPLQTHASWLVPLLSVILGVPLALLLVLLVASLSAFLSGALLGVTVAFVLRAGLHWRPLPPSYLAGVMGAVGAAAATKWPETVAVAAVAAVGSVMVVASVGIVLGGFPWADIGYVKWNDLGSASGAETGGASAIVDAVYAWAIFVVALVSIVYQKLDSWGWIRTTSPSTPPSTESSQQLVDAPGNDNITGTTNMGPLKNTYGDNQKNNMKVETLPLLTPDPNKHTPKKYTTVCADATTSTAAAGRNLNLSQAYDVTQQMHSSRYDA